IAGELIKFNTKGLDFALTALFVVLFIEQIKSKDNRLMGLFGVLTTLVCLIVFKSNVFIIPSMLLILGILALNYYSKNKNSAQKTNTEKSEGNNI
ncbi:MAG: branched-chain amino acid ABC transporter permease, partial [Oscillospiraceae bacterium]